MGKPSRTGAVAQVAATGTADRRRFFEGFADLMYRRRDVRSAFDTYVATDYIQHNPGLADGRDAARDALAVKFAEPGFSRDRIVEHWDVIQPWPSAAANDHPMF